MNKVQFISLMQELNINQKFFSINGEIKEYSYNLVDLQNNNFNVFYFERGEKTLEKNFSSLDDAYQYLFEIIKVNIEHGLDLSQ